MGGFQRREGELVEGTGFGRSKTTQSIWGRTSGTVIDQESDYVWEDPRERGNLGVTYDSLNQHLSNRSDQRRR